MTIYASSPARTGLLGNPSDMYGGSVLSCAVAPRAWCRISESDTLTISVSGQTEEITHFSQLKVKGDMLDVARVSLEFAFQNEELPKIALSAGTDVPVQAGLAGSGAIMMSITAALSGFKGEQLRRWQLAERVGHVEFHKLGVVCGYQDQCMTAYGGLQFMDFRGLEHLNHAIGEKKLPVVEPLTELIAAIPAVLAYTGVKHHSGSVHKTIRQLWEEGDKKVMQAMERIGEIGREGKRVLLTKNWQALAELMNENHAIVRDLGGSGTANERLISAALEGGALGAKLAGAGGGGTIIALTLDPDKTKQALKNAGAEQFIELNIKAPGVAVDMGL